MRVFFDSSAFVKRCNQEQGSEDVLRGCDQETELGLVVIALPEMVSALCRLLREERLGCFFYRPPPNLPPLGGGVNSTALNSQDIANELSSTVPSPIGGGLGWGRVKSVASLPFDRPPPSLPPLGGGVNPTALVLSPHRRGLGWSRLTRLARESQVPSPTGGGLGWGRVKSEASRLF